MSQYQLLISGNAPALYPSETFFALLYYARNEALEIPKQYPFQGEWGQVVSTHLMLDDDHPMPRVLDMVWLSIVERKFYSIQCRLPFERMEQLWQQTDEESGDPLFKYIVVGMAPYGGVAVWSHGEKKSVLTVWLSAEETNVDMKDFMPMNPTVTLDENCDFYIDNNPVVKDNLEINGLPPRNLFDKYMQQFNYRYLPLFERWDEDEEKWQKYGKDQIVPEFDYIEESLFDGTHDKLHDDGLLSYHEAGKPKRLAVRWHVRKSEYTAYFWLMDDDIRSFFDRFYGAHPESKSDFMIRIDHSQNKYELALFRYGMSEPQVIHTKAWQLIVFKNGFEHFRSENYDQPGGAWAW